MILKERDITYDIMKGIGILLVLLGHVWQLSGTVGHVITSFHMPLFFVVAGCFSKTFAETAGKNRWHVIMRYVQRLYLPFLFATSVLALWFIAKSINNSAFTNQLITTILSAAWASVAPLPTPWGNVSIGAVWFLMALLSGKVLFLFVSKWERWLLPISLFLSIGAYILGNVFPYFPWCILYGALMLPFLVVGKWWYRHRHLPLWSAICLIIMWMIALVFSKLDIYSWTITCYPLDMIGALGGVYIVYLLSAFIANRGGAITKSLFAYLGVISLPILCWHHVDISASVLHQLLGVTHIPFSEWSEYFVRYTLTILLAIASVNIPYLKKIFV